MSEQAKRDLPLYSYSDLSVVTLKEALRCTPASNIDSILRLTKEIELAEAREAAQATEAAQPPSAPAPEEPPASRAADERPAEGADADADAGSQQPTSAVEQRRAEAQQRLTELENAAGAATAERERAEEQAETAASARERAKARLALIEPDSEALPPAANELQRAHARHQVLQEAAAAAAQAERAALGVVPAARRELQLAKLAVEEEAFATSEVRLEGLIRQRSNELRQEIEKHRELWRRRGTLRCTIAGKPVMEMSFEATTLTMIDPRRLWTGIEEALASLNEQQGWRETRARERAALERSLNPTPAVREAARADQERQRGLHAGAPTTDQHHKTPLEQQQRDRVAKLWDHPDSKAPAHPLDSHPMAPGGA